MLYQLVIQLVPVASLLCKFTLSFVGGSGIECIASLLSFRYLDKIFKFGFDMIRKIWGHAVNIIPNLVKKRKISVNTNNTRK